MAYRRADSVRRAGLTCRIKHAPLTAGPGGAPGNERGSQERTSLESNKTDEGTRVQPATCSRTVAVWTSVCQLQNVGL